MKKITLELSTAETRLLYDALICASVNAEKIIEEAERFPESDVLQASGKRAREKKSNLDAFVRKLLKGLTDEQWSAVVMRDGR